MERAIQLSNISLGGPFGAVVVNKEGIIIGEGHNEVTTNNDPTAHAEIVAIRRACNNTNNFQLDDCVIYTSCEPCPMCLSACYWARISKIYYANTREDAANIGFDDKYIYDEFSKSLEERSIPIIKINDTGAIKTFNNWQNNINKILY